MMIPVYLEDIIRSPLIGEAARLMRHVSNEFSAEMCVHMGDEIRDMFDCSRVAARVVTWSYSSGHLKVVHEEPTSTLTT